MPDPLLSDTSGNVQTMSRMGRWRGRACVDNHGIRDWRLNVQCGVTFHMHTASPAILAAICMACRDYA